MEQTGLYKSLNIAEAIKVRAKEKKIATLNKKAKEQNRSVTVLRRLVGGTIMAAVVVYLVPELRQDIFSTIKWLNDEWRR